MKQKYKDIRALLKLTLSSDLSKSLIKSFTQKIPVAPELIGKIHDILLSKENMKELDNGVAVIYDKNFTHKEIKDIIKFYKTKSGKKLLSKIPEITLQSMEVGQAWGLKVYEKGQNEILKAITEYVIGGNPSPIPTEAPDDMSPDSIRERAIKARAIELKEYVESRGWDISKLEGWQYDDIANWAKTHQP